MINLIIKDKKMFHISPEDFLNQKEIELMGITKAAGEIYFCTKRIR